MTGTLPTVGAISFGLIQSTFGLSSGTISLGDFYKGGSIIPSAPSNNANVPSSGKIGFADLYGTTNYVPPSVFNFTPTISANVNNWDLLSELTSAGWNGSEQVAAVITVNSNVIVGSSSTGSVAMTLGILPANSTLELNNNGYILGMGGNGGAGAGGNVTLSSVNMTNAGSAGDGGNALNVGYPMTLKGGGVIGGGGGGGGGGQSAFSQDVPGPPGTNTYVSILVGGGAGGAGAGINTGTGGAAQGVSNARGAAYPGSGGGNGSGTGSGAPGSGGAYPYYSGAYSGGGGGQGGTLGHGGNAGLPAYGSAANYGANSTGANPGYSIVGYGNVSVQWQGSIEGPTS